MEGDGPEFNVVESVSVVELTKDSDDGNRGGQSFGGNLGAGVAGGGGGGALPLPVESRRVRGDFFWFPATLSEFAMGFT